MSFSDKFPTKEFISCGVGRVDEFGEDFEVRLLYFDGAVGVPAILKHEEISEPRPDR